MPFCDLLGAFNVALITLGVGKGGRTFPKLLASLFSKPTSEEPSLAVLFGDMGSEISLAYCLLFHLSLVVIY